MQGHRERIAAGQLEASVGQLESPGVPACVEFGPCRDGEDVTQLPRVLDPRHKREPAIEDGPESPVEPLAQVVLRRTVQGHGCHVGPPQRLGDVGGPLAVLPGPFDLRFVPGPLPERPGPVGPKGQDAGRLLGVGGPHVGRGDLEVTVGVGPL